MAGKKINRSQKRKRARANRRRARIRRRRFVALCLVIFFAIYQTIAGNSTRAVKSAFSSIKEWDLTTEDKKFDRMGNINKILAKSFSSDPATQEEFIKAVYKNLDYKIVSKEKTEDGILVDLDITNLNYMEVFDKISASKPKDLDREFLEALEKGEGEKKEKRAKLLLVRGFRGYKIYESRDFYNAILGGALEYADSFEEN